MAEEKKKHLFISLPDRAARFGDPGPHGRDV